MTVRLYTNLPPRFSDIAEILHIFSPDAQVIASSREEADVVHLHTEREGFQEDRCEAGSHAFVWTTPVFGDALERKRRLKRGIKQCCFYLMQRKTGGTPPWGSLTGIRPTRLLHDSLSRGEGMEQALSALSRLYSLSDEKAELLSQTVHVQNALAPAAENAIDIYVGIPFCKTRCSYCSFFAEAVGRGKKVPPYLAALQKELAAAAEIVREAGLAPRALYIGGGTPTALDADQLAGVMEALLGAFPGAEEFTVEAGRPDTVDRQKLAAMRAAGVSRISINPQTMNDETLLRIGRAHTAEDTVRAYEMAREMGFDNINMDLIAALPGETLVDFANTLSAVETLCPDSITVHTLARKHGSKLNEQGFEKTNSHVAARMVEMGQEMARELGMRPYYLYRQKYVAGNLENVAYASAGCECLYNIDIMEETTSILAIGAGAISKRIYKREMRIERAPNVGDVGHYMERVDEMIERKRRLFLEQ